MACFTLLTEREAVDENGARHAEFERAVPDG